MAGTDGAAGILATLHVDTGAYREVALPVAAAGTVLYWLPYQAPRLVARTAKEPDVVSTYKLGTGLVLFRLAESCERYVGTDLSAVGLETIRRQLDSAGLDQVELRHQIADDFTGLEPGAFDLVILNSVVPVLLLIGAGYGYSKLRTMDVRTLVNFVIEVSVPS